MLPAAYQLPAAIVLILSGAVACFFGHRLFRIVLLIFGFLIGAFAASSIFGMSDTTPMLIAAAVGGILGALILRAAYFVGVALVGAAIGATVINLVFSALHKGIVDRVRQIEPSYPLLGLDGIQIRDEIEFERWLVDGIA